MGAMDTQRLDAILDRLERIEEALQLLLLAEVADDTQDLDQALWGDTKGNA